MNCPRLEQFSNYGDFALAAVGYAFCQQSGLGVAIVANRDGGGGVVDVSRVVCPGSLVANVVRGGPGAAVGDGSNSGCGLGSRDDGGSLCGDCVAAVGVSGGLGQVVGGESAVGVGTSEVVGTNESCVGDELQGEIAGSVAGGVEDRDARLEYRKERNRAAREKKKRRKESRRVLAAKIGVEPVAVGLGHAAVVGVEASQADVPKWRRKSGVAVRPAPVSGSGRVGYFSGCSEEVQRELCDSRAAVLVARNRRELAEEKTKLARMASPEALVKAVAHAVSVGERLKKQTVNSKIGGWAETVVESMVESVVRSAPSSVPSLESVGYGKSAVSEEGVPESKKTSDIAVELRKTQYALAMATLESSCDAMPYVPGPYYEEEVEKIRREYADVVESPEVAMKNKFVDELLEIYEGAIPDAVLKKMVSLGWVAASGY